MKVKIINALHDDSIEFNIDALTEENKDMIKEQVRKRGWGDGDCYSEIEDNSEYKGKEIINWEKERKWL